MRVAAAERIADAVGPIVVKEVRQGLRARVFAICFGLLLAACLVVALIAATEVRESVGQALGPRYLTFFLWGLGVVCFLVIPYTAFRSMAREREDETWVLLVLTGLSSRRIVRGKVASALSQALLYSSAGAPFMVFSYFLNGVDLPTLLVVAWFATCWALFLTCLAVALGTEGRTRLGRGAVHFLVLALLGCATIGGLTFGANLAREGQNWLDEEGFRIFVAAFPVALLSMSVLSTEGAAAGLSLTSESSVKGVRMVILLQQVVAVAATYLGMSLSTSRSYEAPMWASILSSVTLVVIGAFVISERDGFPRVDRGAKNWLTGGALRGWKLIIGLLILNTVAWAALYRLGSSAPSRDFRALYTLLAAPLYVGLFLSLAVVIGRLSSLRKLGEPLATRISFAALVAAAMILFPVAAVIARNEASEPAWNYLNPFWGMVNFLGRSNVHHARTGLGVLIIGFSLVAPVAWGVLKGRDTERNA